MVKRKDLEDTEDVGDVKMKATGSDSDSDSDSEVSSHENPPPGQNP